MPPGVFEDEDANTALSNVHIKSIRVGGPWVTKRHRGLGGGSRASSPVQLPIVFHVSVAIQQDGAEDPIRELLQVYDQLLPQVPRWAEPALPVLSNLASITDATFSLFAYSEDDAFMGVSQIGWRAASHYASATTRQLGKLLHLPNPNPTPNPTPNPKPNPNPNPTPDPHPNPNPKLDPNPNPYP